MRERLKRGTLSRTPIITAFVLTPARTSARKHHHKSASVNPHPAIPSFRCSHPSLSGSGTHPATRVCDLVVCVSERVCVCELVDGCGS